MAKSAINKTTFILGLSGLSAKEVVAKAKSAGFKLSDKYVYGVRAKAKARGGKPAGKPGPKPKLSCNYAATLRGAASPVGSLERKAMRQAKELRHLNGARDAELTFLNAVLDLGTTRCEEILGVIREAAKSAL